MENLRWILIIAGVAILVMLWFSGRRSRRDAAARQMPDPLLGVGSDPGLAQGQGQGVGHGSNDGFADDDFGNFDDVEVEGDDFARPGEPGSNRPGRTVHASGGPASSFDDVPAFEAPAGGLGSGLGLGSLAQKFEAIGAMLAPKRRQRVAEIELDDVDTGNVKVGDSKIVTLHVQAPAGEILPPEALYELFEQRGYHHGDMNIFHSLYEGQTVFSVARMVNPGFFDLDDISTFETPGISFILQLPAPVAADTGFEVMLSEAREMADALGATVLDGSHSTLGRQTEQHLRESIYEYMHRQKYADGVAG